MKNQSDQRITCTLELSKQFQFQHVPMMETAMIRVHVQVLDVYVTMDGKVVMIVQYFIVRIIMIVTIKGFATMEHVNVRLVGISKVIAPNSLV